MKKLLTLLFAVILFTGCSSNSQLTETFEAKGFSIKYNDQIELLNGESTAFFTGNVKNTNSTINVMMIPDYTLLANSIEELEAQILEAVPVDTKFNDIKVSGMSARQMTLADDELTVRTILVPDGDSVLIIQTTETNQSSSSLFTDMIASIKITN